MITNKIDNSTILVVDNIDSTLNDLVSFYPKHLVRIIKNEEGNSRGFGFVDF